MSDICFILFTEFFLNFGIKSTKGGSFHRNEYIILTYTPFKTYLKRAPEVRRKEKIKFLYCFVTIMSIKFWYRSNLHRVQNIKFFL